MPKQIIWSPLAENDFSDILDYLDKKWDKKVASNFIDLAENTINQISNNPKQFPVIFNKKRFENVFLPNIILFFIGTQDQMLRSLGFMTQDKILTP